MNSRKILPGVAAALLVTSVLMPTGWYAALPLRADLGPPPVSGASLLRVTLALEGVLLLLVAAFGWRYTRRSDALDSPALADGDALDRRTARWWLAGITVLALVLRVYRISSDLWLDEISAIVGFGRSPVLEILTVFSRSGNHLLNTLLIKACVALFGEREWAVRLPAMVFGVATVPALYWTARLALPRRASLATALLLAVSYHHIFFSQSARGYASYMFFSVVSTGMFVRALDTDTPRAWGAYIVLATLNVASLILSAFVLAGHFLVGSATDVERARGGGDGWAHARRLVGVFVIVGLLGLTIYAVVLPQAFAGLTTPYKTQASGYSPVSSEFAADAVRGVLAGFGPLLLIGAIPFLAVGALGFVVLLRRRWTLAAALVSPLALTFAAFVLVHMTLRPRFYLLALPVAMLCVVVGVWALSSMLTQRLHASATTTGYLRAAAIAFLTLASLTSLVTYYRVPKQSYRAALTFIEATRRPGDTVIVFGNAELGFRFYGERAGLSGNPDYVYVREPARVESLVTARKGRRTYLVFTLARDIRLRFPAFVTYLQQGWTKLRVFPATVGDGAITVIARDE